uniref:(northern house mosquito) hypothetical protein n=1 Tax=Culex pipiens TaxID=7175 RepID=A0A8D8IML3_CULPI
MAVCALSKQFNGILERISGRFRSTAICWCRIRSVAIVKIKDPHNFQKTCQFPPSTKKYSAFSLFVDLHRNPAYVQSSSRSGCTSCTVDRQTIYCRRRWTLSRIWIAASIFLLERSKDFPKLRFEM